MLFTYLHFQGWDHAYNVTNVEYTEFEKLGISDECASNSEYSRYPANTNVLYIGLQVHGLKCSPEWSGTMQRCSHC